MHATSDGNRAVSLRHGHLMSGDCYADTGEPYDWANPRPCKGCGANIQPGGNDPCIKNLPGTSSACCGHGADRNPCDGEPAGYVELSNGTIIRFSGSVGGDRIRAAVQAAIEGQPLPDGFRYAFIVTHLARRA
jgi:hypothetical protein